MKKFAGFFTLVVAMFLVLGGLTNSFAQKVPDKPTKIKMCNSCHKEGKNKFEEYKVWLVDNHKNAATIAETTEKFEKPEVTDDCKTCHTNSFEGLDVTKLNPKKDIDCLSCHDSKSEVHPIDEEVAHPKVEGAE